MTFQSNPITMDDINCLLKKQTLASCSRHELFIMIAALCCEIERLGYSAKNLTAFVQENAPFIVEEQPEPSEGGEV